MWGWFIYGGAAGIAVGLLGLLITLRVLGRKLKACTALANTTKEGNDP